MIFAAFAAFIYLSAEKKRETEFYHALKKEATTKLHLLLEAKIDPKILQKIYHNNRQILNEVEVAIYDVHFNLLYHDAVEIDFVKETPQMIEKIHQKGEIKFYQNQWQVIGLRYFFGNKEYIITAAAYDQYGYNKIKNLLNNSILAFTIAILFVLVTGYLFSKKAFEPVIDMIEEVKQISAKNLSVRLKVQNKDEISLLADTFNQMLDRLEDSFDAQKHFVHNISHELRTPLTAIISELELALNKERGKEEYKSAILNVLNDTKKLVRLSNSLLDLAKASYDCAEISFEAVRIDEVLLDTVQLVHQSYPHYKVNLYFEKDFEGDQQISVKGNEYLLKTAFFNLMENGCKFSQNHECKVSVSFDQENIYLQFSDTGIGISQEDLQNIFKPFYRGKNKHFAEGNGIGLYLTQKIILLHKGSIFVDSSPNKGTNFHLAIKHL